MFDRWIRPARRDRLATGLTWLIAVLVLVVAFRASHDHAGKSRLG